MGFEVNLTLVQLRQIRKIKQSDLAKKMGLSEPGFRRKENGENPLLFSEVQKLCEIYQLTLDDMAKIIANTLQERQQNEIEK
jgi:transcriptional regulator with XRE-family HTH domain